MSEARVSVWFGGAFMALGLGIFAMTHLAPDGAQAPGFVLDAAAGAFFLAGASVVARGWEMQIAARACSLLMLYLLAVPGLWLFLGDDVGSCTVTAGLGGALQRGAGDPILCRTLVGGGAILTVVIAAAFTFSFARWVRQRLAARR